MVQFKKFGNFVSQLVDQESIVISRLIDNLQRRLSLSTRTSIPTFPTAQVSTPDHVLQLFWNTSLNAKAPFASFALPQRPLPPSVPRPQQFLAKHPLTL